MPLPGARLDPLPTILPAGTRLWRVHRDSVAATDFSRAPRATRFGPLDVADGSPVGLWYGASDITGAIFESVFHDVPVGAAAPRVLFPEFAARVASPIVTTADVRLIDCTSIGLRRLRVARARLIESTSDQYPRTRAWGVALRAADPAAAGILWVSRQHDLSRSVVLFGDRVPDDLLAPDPTESALVLGAGAGLVLVEELAEHAGITIILP